MTSLSKKYKKYNKTNIFIKVVEVVIRQDPNQYILILAQQGVKIPTNFDVNQLREQPKT